MTEAITGEDDSARRMQMVSAAAAQLSEHFDSVLIVVTAPGVGESTYLHHASRGNTYASIAGAQRWLAIQKETWSQPPDDD